MSEPTLLSPERARSLRGLLLVLAILAGLAASMFVLASQPATDFLREGPARLLPFEGGAARVVLGIGAALATIVAGAALWRGVSVTSIVVAAIAVGIGFLLIHVLLTLAIGLFTLSVLAYVAGRTPRVLLVEAGPRRYPLRWAAGGVVVAAALVVGGVVSYWLASPLWDEGTMLDEGLGFEVAGMPTASPTAAAAGAAATETATATEAPTEAASPTATEAGASPTAASGTETPTATAAAETPTATAAPSGQGSLISMGELMGADSFHTGSGQVLLVRAPDGSVILRFQDYEVRNGPDLFIYLTPDPDGDVFADGAIELSEIRATRGNVNYEVPADVDPSTFRAAVIWCKAFAVLFAHAELE